MINTELTFVFSETIADSHGFTGKGSATYPNGDIYKGEFKDGVSLI